MTIIYIQLLNEGTVVYRPVDAEKISENLYRVHSTNLYHENRNDEEWEFLPMDIVRVKNMKLSEGIKMVAFSKI